MTVTTGSVRDPIVALNGAIPGIVAGLDRLGGRIDLFARNAAVAIASRPSLTPIDPVPTLDTEIAYSLNRDAEGLAIEAASPGGTRAAEFGGDGRAVPALGGAIPRKRRGPAGASVGCEDRHPAHRRGRQRLDERVDPAGGCPDECAMTPHLSCGRTTRR